MGFVDLHNHLLWGIDDGCATLEESLAAARLLVASGFDTVATSPHAAGDFPSLDWSLCERRRAEVQAALDAEGIPLALHPNSENKLDEGFLARVDGPERRGIGATQRWALVELPFQSAVPALPELVFRLRRKGVMPLFAHPERCLEFERPGRAAEVVRLGGALQLNVGALASLYGRGARKLAEKLLGEGLYAVAATDLHVPHRADEWLEEGLHALEKRAGREASARLLSDNPRRVLAGEELG
jgi:protein-tyrosine phosphatase